MNALQKCMSVLLITFGTYISVLNWSAPVLALLKDKRSSTIPFIGGLICGVGLFLWPEGLLRPYWPALLILDPTLIVMWVCALLTASLGKRPGGPSAKGDTHDEL